MQALVIAQTSLFFLSCIVCLSHGDLLGQDSEEIFKIIEEEVQEEIQQSKYPLGTARG